MRTLLCWAAALMLAVSFVPSAASAQGVDAASKELVAVLDLQGVQATPAETLALSDRLREVILKTDRFKLVERGQLDQVLDEQALQQTGCTSQECAVQVGRILGVRKLILGKVVKVSDEVWLLSAMIVDVETAETLRAESVRHKGDYFTLMDARIREIGEKLSAAEGTAGMAAAVPALPAAVETPAAAPRLKVGLFPGNFTGQYIEKQTAGRTNKEWILRGIRRAVLNDTRLVVEFSFYEGFGVPAVTHQVTEDHTWKGFFSKDVERPYVEAWARDLNVDAALVVSAAVSGSDGPVEVYLYDRIRGRWYERSTRWTKGKLGATVEVQVRDALTEFEERNP